MNPATKQIIIYGAFGLLLGAKIIDVLFTGGGLLDWWVLLMGLAAAVIHYLPVRKNETKEQNHHQASESYDDSASDALLLRDHPHPERGGEIAPLPERPAQRRAGR